MKKFFARFLVFFLWAFVVYGQGQSAPTNLTITVNPAFPWSGILSVAHGMDWKRAGAQNSHSSGWTQCGSTVPAGSSAATINTAITNCGTNQYVLLAAGSYSLSSGINITKSNVALRGSGADQTIITFTAAGSCNGLGSLLCVQGPNQAASGNPSGTNWTSGYAQGTSFLTLASVAGITLNQTMLVMDQCDTGTTGVPCSGTETDNGNFYVCSQVYSSTGPTGCIGESPSNAYRTLRSQIQITYATAINGNIVTIADPIVSPNWASGQSPQVWLYNAVNNVGFENMSIDSSGINSGGGTLVLYGCQNCWVTGNRFINPGKYSVRMFESDHVDVQRNYSYGAQNSDPYCISPDYSSYLKIETNIIQKCRSTIVYEGPDVGTVVAYNYSIYDTDVSDDSFMWFSLWTHSATSMYNLYEGNVGNGLVFDNIHGGHLMNTLFRNYYIGWEPGKSTQTDAAYSAAYSRYSHYVGNVMGRSGVATTYQSAGAANNAIFILGAGGDTNAVPTDAFVLTSSMRWGNYDTKTAAVRWCGSLSDTGWSTTCASTSEIPSGLSVYPNIVPTVGDTGIGQSAMPASFYLTSKPAWWNTEPYPPIGPEVSGGTIYGTDGPTYGAAGSQTWNAQSVGGHANNTPAMDCFKNTMSGFADGTNTSALTFNSVSCYGM